MSNMSLGGLLSLKWNNHCSTFLHILSTLHRKQSYDDATVACDGKFYPVHKLVLSTCSEYFEEMFEKTHGKHPVIVLKDIKREVFEALLKYMYIGEVNVVQEKLAELINAAECLKIKGLAVPDEEPEPQNHSTSNKNKTGSHASLPSSLPVGEKDSTCQSSVRNARVSATNNQSTKRKESQSFHNSAPPRKIIRASNEAFRNATPSQANVNEEPRANSGAFGSTVRAPKSIETRESRSSLDERTSTSSSLTNHEEDDIAVWPAAVKEEPVDHVPDEANTESVAAPELGGDDAVSTSHSNNDNSDNDGGGGHENNGGGEHDVGDEDGARPASSTLQSEEKNEECSGEVVNEHQEMMDSKVEVAEVEESSDDWEGVLVEKGDGDDAEALSNMLSGDDASNTPAEDRTSGMKYLSRPSQAAARDEWWELSTLLPGCEKMPDAMSGGGLPASQPPPRPRQNISGMASSAQLEITNALLFPQHQDPQQSVYITSSGKSRVGLSPRRDRLPSPQHVCPSCHYQALSRSKLIVHMRCHSGEKPYACHVCPYRSINRGNLTAHMRTHEGQEPYRCTKCDFRAKFRKELMYHVTLVHNGSHQR